jgi:NTP pyrophosphatase (non-canonical NTP hydrolase)
VSDGIKYPPNEHAAWNGGLHFLMDQCTRDSKRWFPKTKDDLAFMVLAMAGEVGEVANIVKKVERGSMTLEHAMDQENKSGSTLQEEVVDVLIYLLNLMALPQFKDVDWMSIWYEKRQFNEERFGVNGKTICVESECLVDHNQTERPA